METRNCESCGMPMKKTEDFGGGDPQNKYCRFCTDEKGNLKSYQEKVEDFKNFLMKTQDLSESQAVKMAKDSLKQFPAWKNVKE
jgi:hypothetical protein